MATAAQSVGTTMDAIASGVTDDPNRREDSLLEAIPRDIRKVYRIRPIIEKIVDKGSFFEMGNLYGRSVVTGFARIDGWPVALMASVTSKTRFLPFDRANVRMTAGLT